MDVDRTGGGGDQRLNTRHREARRDRKSDEPEDRARMRHVQILTAPRPVARMALERVARTPVESRRCPSARPRNGRAVTAR